MSNLTLRESIKTGLVEALESDTKVFLMGEDIGDYNGAYAVTAGLLKKFGPKRIIDTPISESVILGTGIGAAAAGLRPIVEIMTINFSINESTNQDKLIIFLEKNCNFNFIPIEKTYEFNDLKLIILQKNISKERLSKILENINNQNSQVFAHKSLQDKIPPNYNIIF